MTDIEDAREDVEAYMKERRREIVTFEPKGFRDVHWCPYLKEPFIIEYRGPDKKSYGSIKYCVNCDRLLDDEYEFIDHVFICNIGKL